MPVTWTGVRPVVPVVVGAAPLAGLAPVARLGMASAAPTAPAASDGDGRIVRPAAPVPAVAVLPRLEAAGLPVIVPVTPVAREGTGTTGMRVGAGPSPDVAVTSAAVGSP